MFAAFSRKKKSFLTKKNRFFKTRSMIPRYVGNKRKASLTTPTIDENRGFEAAASSEATEACPHRNVEHISELDLILSGEFLMLGEPGPPETQSEPGATPPNRWLKITLLLLCTLEFHHSLHSSWFLG